MNSKGSLDFNIIKSENNNDNKYILLEDKQDLQKFISKTEYPKFGHNFSSKDINKESIRFKVNREKNSNINNKVKYRFLKKNYETKIVNDLNIDKINDAINNINIKLDTSLLNNNIETIKINRKTSNFKKYETDKNNIIPYTQKNNAFLRKNQKSIDNNSLNKKLAFFTDRNRPQLKMMANSNRDLNKNANLDIVNCINPIKKRIFASLKLNTKSSVPKINDCYSSNKDLKSYSKIKKRYNSVRPISPGNESLKVNKKINSTQISNYNKIQKSFSLNNNQNFKNLNNNSFMISNIKNKFNMSPKEQLIEEKIKELNLETQKFREERNKINDLKLEYEKLQTKLIEDIDDFVKKKEEFEKFKQNEINNINKERKNMLLDNKFILNIKNQNKSLELEIKKNEETISQLKMQINDLQLIIKNKDIEIKNLQKIINDKDIYKKVTSTNKVKDIKPRNESISYLSTNKKNNSVKIFNNNIKNTNLYNSKTIKTNKLNVNNNNPHNQSISNNHSVLNTLNIYKKIKYNNNNDSKLNLNNSNQINNKSLLLYNNTLNKNTIVETHSSYNIKSDLDYNTTNNSKYNNNSKMETIKSIKNSFLSSNNHIIQNYKSKNILNPIHCKLKKNFKNTMKIKTEFINKKINKKNYKTNASYSNSAFENINSDNLSVVQNLKEKILSEVNINDNDIDINTNNNNYDFIIPEKYIQIDKNDNKIINILNINGNNINIYANNKKEIIYPDGNKQIIYNDNHQIIYYKNGNIKQIFTNGKTVFYDCIEEKVETSYENGIIIIKYKNGKIERFSKDNKENQSNNIILNENYNINEIDKKHKNSGTIIYSNKFKTIKKK